MVFCKLLILHLNILQIDYQCIQWQASSWNNEKFNCNTVENDYFSEYVYCFIYYYSINSHWYHDKTELKFIQMIIQGTTSFWPSCERECSRNGFEQLVTAKVSLQFSKLDRLTLGHFQRTFCGNHGDKVGWLTEKLNFEKCKIGLKAVNQLSIFRTSCWTTFTQRTQGFNSVPVSVIYCISKPRSVHNSQS